MTRATRCFLAMICLGMMLSLGCTEENVASSENNGQGWIDPDAQGNDEAEDAAVDTGDEADADEDTATTPDTIDPADTIDPTDTAGGDDAGGDPDPDVIEPDTSDPADSGTSTDSGTADTGGGGSVDDSCTTNSECGQNLVCCPTDFSGNATCQASDDCRLGGYCQSDSECATGEACCELLGSRICSDRCVEPDPGSQTPCTNNADCSGDEICCSDGQNELCTTRDNCRTGGICDADSQCQTGETCCDIPRIGDRCIDPNFCF